MHRDRLPTNELSPREREVLLEYARLGSYTEVARALYLSRATVRQHLLNARRKLGANSSIQALWRIK